MLMVERANNKDWSFVLDYFLLKMADGQICLSLHCDHLSAARRKEAKEKTEK